MPKTVHRQVDSNGCQSIYNKNYIISPSAFQKKTSLNIPITSIVKSNSHPCYPRHVTDGYRTEKKRNPRETTCSRSRFLFQDVFGKEIGWRTPTDFRLKSLKFLHCDKAFLFNIPSGCNKLSSDKGLDGENRYSPSILSFMHGRDTQTFPACSVQWRDTTTDSSAVWPIFSPPFICSSLELGCGNPSKERNSPDGIFGRLPSCMPGQVQVDCAGFGNARNLGVSRLARKLSKVRHSANTQTRVLGSSVGHTKSNDSLANPKSPKNKAVHFQNFVQQPMLTEGDSESIRHTKLCQPGHSSGSTTLSQRSTFSEEVYPPRSKEITMPQCATGPRVVVECSGKQSNSTYKERSYSLPDNRRSGCGLGGSSKQPVSVWKMDPKSKRLALKCKGDVRSICGNQIPGCSVKERPHVSPIRQPDSGSLYTESGRNPVTESPGSNNQTVRDDMFSEHNDDSLLPARLPERHRGSPVKGTTGAGVASVATCHKNDIQRVGHPRCRPIRIQKNRRCATVRHARLRRWLCTLLRRFQSQMGVPNRLDISTPQHNSESASTPQSGNRDILASNTPVDPMLLVCRSSGESTNQSLSNREPAEGSHRSDDRNVPPTNRELNLTGLESWGWANQVKGWSRDEQQLLSRSWRPSTLQTYTAPLKRWLSWCQSNNINSIKPEGQNVARFLADLYLKHKFAYNTILLHKSAISTYCAAGVDNLSKDFFVQQVLKAISYSTPQSVKPPIWDVNIVLSWLKSSTGCDSLFNISRRAALILLLASGRRLHDLTLLELSQDGFAESESTITLWPKFGSKTDSGKYRQSGWLLTSHEDHHICPVVHIKKLVRVSEARRRTVTGCKALFITVTGQVKAASRTVISGWIRSIFKQVKIDASPGSTRSAVASKGWMDKRPIEEILERGNWKSVRTFSRFYCREISRGSEEGADAATDSLYDNFKAL